MGTTWVRKGLVVAAMTIAMAVMMALGTLPLFAAAYGALIGAMALAAWNA